MIKTVGDVSDVTADSPWLDPDSIDAVAVTSEDPEYPIEDALSGRGRGWRASAAGIQHLALKFRAPATIRRVRLVFEEPERGRTHEFALEWRAAEGTPARTVVRQQFTFAPPGTSVEREDYATDLRGVERLELTLVPDISDATAFASLKEWRIGREERLATAVTPEEMTATGPSHSGAVVGAASPDDAEARWRAWRAKGSAHDRAVESALFKVVPVVIAAAIATAVVFSAR